MKIKTLVIGTALFLVAVVGIIKADYTVYEVDHDGRYRYVGYMPDSILGGYVTFYEGTIFDEGRDFYGLPSAPMEGAGTVSGCWIGGLNIPCYMLYGPSVPADPVYWLNRINHDMPTWSVEAGRMSLISSWYDLDPGNCVDYMVMHQHDNDAMIASAATLASIIAHQQNPNPNPNPKPGVNIHDYIGMLSGDAKNLARSWMGRSERDLIQAWLIRINFMQYMPPPKLHTPFPDKLPQPPIP